MNIKEETADKISELKMKKLQSKFAMGLNVKSVGGTASIYYVDNYVCELSELGQFIKELNCLHEAIADVTGITF